MTKKKDVIEKLNAFKKEAFSGFTDKLLMIPWIPSLLAMLLTFKAVLVVELFVNFMIRPNQAVTYRDLSIGLMTAVVAGLLVGLVVKFVVEKEIKEKLKKVGLI